MPTDAPMHKMRRRTHAGLTLLELLIAAAIVVMVLGTLQAVGLALYDAFRSDQRRSTANQHARVVLDRITRTAGEARANEQFPGALIVAQSVGGHRFPDTLVVWHPTGEPAAPDGLPRFNELVVYCPSLDASNELLEITLPDDKRTVPPVSDSIAWAQEIASIKKSRSGRIVVLTGLLRQCATSSTTDAALQGAARFEVRLRPSESDWAGYKAGAVEWNSLPWVQGTYGAQTGLRQAWVRMEIQLTPAVGVAVNDSVEQPVPFFGSAAVYYQMHR